uniref:Transthyretin-like family protein n=1 Tax=Panagrolaimus sp. PS1159 TaxID=55785 RepID=A0AC35G0Z2_9BILA
MFKLTLLILSFIAIFAVVESTVDAGISTRSAEAKGTLLCGRSPAVGVKVYLKREQSEGIEDIIGHAVTDDDGKFVVNGNTERYGGSKSTIDPSLVFYHKCDKPEAKSFQVFNLRFPRTYTTIGRVSRRPYDIGTFNLQIQYPKQYEDKIAPDY